MGGLPPVILILLLAGISLGTVFILGRGMFAPGLRRWIDLAGHASLVFLGVSGMHFLTQTFRATGDDRFKSGLVTLAVAWVMALLGRRLFGSRDRKTPRDRP
jgi:hypothetical protein